MDTKWGYWGETEGDLTAWQYYHRRTKTAFTACETFDAAYSAAAERNAAMAPGHSKAQWWKYGTERDWAMA